MSGGLFGLVTAADRTAQAGLGSPPGRKGKDGVGIFDAFQVAGSASFHLVLSNGQDREIFLPKGSPGLDGITPTFTAGTIQSVPSGGTASFALVPTATPGLYSYNVTLVAGPMPWAFPVAYAAGIVATPNAPATQVTYGKSTFVCTTAHTTTSTFDTSKWICVAQGGADGNGNVTGTASSVDLEIIIADGASSTKIKGSGVRFGTGAGMALRFDPTSGKYPAGDGSLITNLSVTQARFSNVLIITSSRTWTTPGKVRGRATVIGTGGSSALVRASASSNNVVTGGGAGGVCVKAFTANAGTQFVATIGARATVTTYGVNTTINGGAGGDTSLVASAISLNMIAKSGLGGNYAVAAVGTAVSAAGGVGGTATGGDLNYQGGNGGAGSISTAPLGFQNWALTGGGAVAMLGLPFNGGAVSITTGGSNSVVCSGGAGIGGNGADYTQSAGNGYFGSGGGSANGAGSGTTGGPDIFGATGNPYSNTSSPQPLPPVDFQIFNFGGRGGFGIASPSTGSGGDPGAGAGGLANSDTGGNAYGYAGGLFGGGGAAFVQSQISQGGTGGYGAGGGACGNTNGTATAGLGGPAIIIIEYDLVP